jgi:hypothetical protein
MFWEIAFSTVFGRGFSYARKQEMGSKWGLFAVSENELKSI